MQRLILHKYQTRLLNLMVKKGYQALFLDMGMGKTPLSLAYIKYMMDKKLIRKTLVVAPLRVAQVTWVQEAQKWEQFKNLRVISCCGTEKQRREAFAKDADVYCINRENLVWMVKNIPTRDVFDLLVIDELSSFKAVTRSTITTSFGKKISQFGSQRFIALAQIRDRFKYAIGLTGTPKANKWEELWPEIYLLDQGKLFGKNFYAFRNKYFKENIWMQCWDPKPGAVAQITNKLDTIAVSLKAEDYLKMPDKVYNDIWLKMDDKTYKRYCNMADNWYDKETDVTAGNAISKLMQMASGFLYDVNGDNECEYYKIHSLMLQALEEIVEFEEGNILLFYNFRAEKDMILRRFQDKCATRVLDTQASLEAWCRGEIKLAITHPASTGHGLNLQSGGSKIVWFGPNYSFELVKQAEGRLFRQGQQSESVVIHRLLVENTIHERVLEVLDGKITAHEFLMDKVKLWEYTGMTSPDTRRAG